MYAFSSWFDVAERRKFGASAMHQSLNLLRLPEREGSCSALLTAHISSFSFGNWVAIQSASLLKQSVERLNGDGCALVSEAAITRNGNNDRRHGTRGSV